MNDCHAGALRFSGRCSMEFIVDDRSLQAEKFIAFASSVWPGHFDPVRTQHALDSTLNITAYDGERLIGCLRILTDGYFFGTITELLVLPDYQHQGVGSRLLQLAREHSPTTLYFGAQPGVEAFYEKNGCEKGMQAYLIRKKRS